MSPQLRSLLLGERDLLVVEVAADPRRWGFDLQHRGAPRRDVVAELRHRSRTQGALAESVLAGYPPLVELAPNPLTFPDGASLVHRLGELAMVGNEVAQDIAHNLRGEVQIRLGRGLDDAAIARAVREAAWDHDLEPARLLPLVERVLECVS